MMRINLLEMQQYLVQKENAEPIELTNIELRSIQRRVILNCYLDIVIEKLLQRSEYRGLSKKELLQNPNWHKVLFDGSMNFMCDISVYRMPDGCNIEFDTVSGYWGVNNDYNDNSDPSVWSEKICSLFGIK